MISFKQEIISLFFGDPTEAQQMFLVSLPHPLESFSTPRQIPILHL